MLRKYVPWFLAGLLPLAVSCNLLTPLVFVAKHTKTVSPEFDKLPDNRVAILVWTDASTLFDYPHVRLELATYIADKLSMEMNQRKLRTELVDPRDVEDYLQRNAGARIDPHAVGQAFKADYVIYLEVNRFQIRDRDHPQFLQGQIAASVAVHDMHADSDQLRRYPLTPVTCFYPEGAPVLLTAVNSPLVREGVYRKFAEVVARKFYEHTLVL